MFSNLPPVNSDLPPINFNLGTQMFSNLPPINSNLPQIIPDLKFVISGPFAVENQL